jgi:transposase
MGWVTMSERDLQRIEVLTDVLAGRRTVAAAATVLAISERQMYRLLAKYEDGGGSALIHKARGRQSNRRLNAGIRKYAVELVRTRYADFGPHSQQKFYSKSTVCALGERPCAGG